VTTIKTVVRHDVANVSVDVTHRGPDFEVDLRRLVRRDITTKPAVNNVNSTAPKPIEKP
jgi:hypothetical protein